jgi:hypothetical protein
MNRHLLPLPRGGEGRGEGQNLRLLLAFLLTSCTFAPDLSRYEPCADDGTCPTNFVCLREAARCIPTCELSACDPPDAGTPDAGTPDAGTPDAGTPDAGTPDAGTPDAGTPDAGDSGIPDAGEPLVLPAMTLTPAIETQPYSVQFTPTGGVAPYAFFLDGGVPSFTLDTAGTFSSLAATTPGTFPFEITVSDDDQPRARVTTPYSLEVMKLLRVASNTLIEGRTGQPYSVQLAATGGSAPFTWSTDGGLPAGLALTAAGLVEGTPSGNTGGTTREFTVDVVDSSTVPQRATRRIGVQVRGLSTLLLIATPAAADARVGEPYAQTLKAFGGTPPYSWSLASGAFPPGISIVNSGTVGQLGGTPTDAGTYDFTLRCTDGLTPTTQALTIVVY